MTNRTYWGVCVCTCLLARRVTGVVRRTAGVSGRPGAQGVFCTARLYVEANALTYQTELTASNSTDRATRPLMDFYVNESYGTLPSTVILFLIKKKNISDETDKFRLLQSAAVLR